MANQIPVRIRNYYIKGNYTESTDTMVVSNKISQIIYGTGALSKDHYAILCSASNIDALIASPFAMYIEEQNNAQCPILVNKNGENKLDATVYNKLLTWGENEQFKKIYIVGSSELIPDSCIGKSDSMTKTGNIYKRKSSGTFDTNELLNYTPEVERIYGGTRYETAIKIAKKMGNPTYLFFANGQEYIDAYSICAAACYLKSPLLLLPNDYSKDKTEQPYQTITNYFEFLSSKNSVKKIFIAGGNQRNAYEVEIAVREALKLTMPNSVERVAGQNRYDTSLSIAKEFNDFLSKPSEEIYSRTSLDNNQTNCSKIILIDGDDDTNDCPTVPILAAKKLRCPIIVNSYQLKHKLIEGYMNNAKTKIYRDSGKTDEIVLDSSDNKNYYVFKDLTNGAETLYYTWDNSQFTVLGVQKVPNIYRGYSKIVGQEGGVDIYNFYKDKNKTELICLDDTYTMADLYIDSLSNVAFEAKSDAVVSLGNPIPLIKNDEASRRISIKPQHRYYNIMSYLQIKRPQLIYCFSEHSIGKNTASESGKSFENFVKFYNGTLKIDGDNQNYDIVYPSVT